MSAWGMVFVVYAVGAPLVALHVRWVMGRQEIESAERRRDTEETMEMLGVTRGGLAVGAGLMWPLVLVGYVLQLVTRKPPP